MASKTVWIVGGIVVVLGAVLYVTMKEGPANTSATGTIVEAKRARADGTNSMNPTPTASTTDQSSDASKGMAGPDAAKDAATAAAGPAEALRGGGVTGVKGAHEVAAQSADAAAAAGRADMRGTPGSVKGAHEAAAQSADAAAAAARGAQAMRGINVKGGAHEANASAAAPSAQDSARPH